VFGHNKTVMAVLHNIKRGKVIGTCSSSNPVNDGEAPRCQRVQVEDGVWVTKKDTVRHLRLQLVEEGAKYLFDTFSNLPFWFIGSRNDEPDDKIRNLFHTCD
jgi:hypothetical protein